ncbi:MAG TPA: precorrin-8X methylmutase [Chloroflexota bacterium]|jgi:precorrin-8X/cobalt-precorrin-8 methylmutase
MTTLLTRYGLPPAEIEARSLAHVEATLGARLPADPAERAVAVRMVYAAGDLTLADAIRISPGAVSAAVNALCGAMPIIVDVRMLAAAVVGGPLRELGSEVLVALDVRGVAERARAEAITRAAAGMALLAPRWKGAVVAIGTAPTALLALLDLVDAGHAPPAIVVGTPVGFVAAAESKAELMRRAIPYVTVEGTRGGAALAAAAVNALGRLALA